MEIVKRDGITVQPYSIAKIRTAIEAAWHDTLSDGILPNITIKLVVDIVDKVIQTQGIKDVEAIQDLIESTLMTLGHNDVAKAYILYRNNRAEKRRERLKPNPTAMQEYIHASKYARYVPELQRREVYDETVARVELMHLKKFPQLREEINKAFDLVRERRVLPSMRTMQFGGPGVEANNNRGYNCSASLVDRPRVFAEAMFLLLSGCGVGYSVQYDHVDKLPALAYINEKEVRHHVIADTIEGWADAVDALVNSYLQGFNIEFSYHLIRDAGSPLKTSGGRAPGHLKLKNTLEQVRKILHGAQGRQLRPVECHRMMCHIADAVLSGGIRRSAMICLFSFEDSEMMNLKVDANWYPREPWLANANNSCVLVRGEATERQFKRIIRSTRAYGEPGFFFVSDPSHVTNPCVPAGTRILTRDGYREIQNLVGVTLPVWNGLVWSEVTPRITGHNQPMLRVSLSDGTHLDCTAYHEWRVSEGRFARDFREIKVKAIDLQIGDKLQRYQMPVVEGGVDLPHAYTHGFWCADGTTEDAGRKVAILYGVKKQLLPHLDTVRVTDLGGDGRLRAVLPDTLTGTKSSVPLNASLRSRLEWLAGVLDGDGNIAHNPNSPGLVLNSIDKQFLLDVRLMLTTLGVQAKVALMKAAGTTMLPDGKGGTAEFETQDCYRLLINATDTYRLVQLGLKTHRLDLSKASTAPQRDARRFVTVEKVERLPVADIVYCFDEPRNHTGTFEGIVTGQCAEIGLDPILIMPDGTKRTGWAMCNLCEINAAMLTSLEDFEAAGKAATLIGTLQAAYTDMPYLGETTEAIVRRDALLGIGMTGMQDAPQIACHPEMQSHVSRMCTLWNSAYAGRIGINPAARVTCVKPSGTTTLALGNCGSGIHAHHARRYIRRVTADALEVVFQAFKKINPHMCVQKPDGKWVIEFPVEAPEGATLKSDFTATQFLDVVRSTQQNWVIPGTVRESASPGLRHNVSNTVTVRDDEWDAVTEYLWAHRDEFTGVSMIPDSGDTLYAFAPFEAVKTDAQERRWNDLVRDYKPVDYYGLYEAEDGTSLTAEAACANGKCDVSV